MSGCHNPHNFVGYMHETDKSYCKCPKCLDMKIKKIEELLHDFIKSANGRIEKLQNRIQELEIHKNHQIDENRKSFKHINDVEKLFYDECINRDLQSSKKPHKCPVCGGIWEYTNCHACEGKGIIWG